MSSANGRRAVTVVRTSTANLASVLTGLERLGCTVRTTADPGEVAAADRVVLPGVGAFAAAQRAIAAHGLADSLRDRIDRGRPTLGICLGMQLMAQGSEESPGVPGLGVLDGMVESYEPGEGEWRVPQMGWNLVTPARRVPNRAARPRLLRQLVPPGHGPGGLASSLVRIRGPLPGRRGARTRGRVPVPPRAVGRLRQGAAGPLAGGLSRCEPCAPFPAWRPETCFRSALSPAWMSAMAGS